MGKILDEYLKNIKDYTEVIPDEVYETILSMTNSQFESLDPTFEDRQKYFIEGYEELSQSIFDFIHSGRGSFIMGYVSEFNINRLSAGFNTIEELVHFSIWIIERYYKHNTQVLKQWSELKEKDGNKTKKQLLENILMNMYIKEELYEVTFNMKNSNDFNKRLELIKVLEENKCVAYEILTSIQFYIQLDRVHTSLNRINNVYQLNEVPSPLNQTELELRRVT